TAVMPRETVVETSGGGTVVEKRLNANVVRRRHSDPAPLPAAQPAAEPFHFEPAPAQDEPAFVAPVFDEPPKLEAEIPELPVLEPEPESIPSAPPVAAAPPESPAEQAPAAQPYTAPEPGLERMPEEASPETMTGPAAELEQQPEVLRHEEAPVEVVADSAAEQESKPMADMRAKPEHAEPPVSIANGA